MKPFNVFPYDSNFDFMRLRWVSLTIAALLLVVAIGAIAFKGFNFALDFTGGVSVELRYDKAPDVDGVRAKLADLARMEIVLSELVCACHARKGNVSCPLIASLQGEKEPCNVGSREAATL